jgi:sec-independent protein translocase protein TatA
MFGLGTAEIVVILVIGLLLFGNKLPSLARTLGATLSDLNREVRNLTEDTLSPR